MDIFQYFIKDYQGPPFVLFGTVHIATLIVVAMCIFALTFFKGAPAQVLTRARWSMAMILWLNEAAWHLWNVAIGTWTIQTMLPLHLCSVMIWLAGFMLIFRNYTIYEFIYFLGISGALQALLTPDTGIYSFPHFRYIQTMLSHGLLVGVGVYMTVVEGFRPTWKSILRVFVIANIYMLIIYFVNAAIGSDYMMVNAKPALHSLLDLLPDWPWYLAWLELIALANFLILYLPFIIKDWRTKRATDQPIPEVT